jgi:DNA-directed RNA polymerase subunit RPC12/RpoP
VLERIKKMSRPDGMIQCNRCGSRTIMNTVNGAFIKNGRRVGGTKCDIDVCYDCHKLGIYSPMPAEPPKPAT